MLLSDVDKRIAATEENLRETEVWEAHLGESLFYIWEVISKKKNDDMQEKALG